MMLFHDSSNWYDLRNLAEWSLTDWPKKVGKKGLGNLKIADIE